MTSGDALTLAESAVLEDVAFLELWTANTSSRGVMLEGIPERIRGGYATANFFELLGVKAALGRVFTRDDAASDTIVLSHGFWTRHFGQTGDVIGRSVRIGDSLKVVLGVLPPDVKFTYPDPTDVWAVLPPPARSKAISMHVVGRLRPNSTLQQSAVDLTRVWERSPQTRPRAREIALNTLADWTSVTSRRPILFLGAASTLVLLISVANTTLLLLARSRLRQRETAIRLALGAARLQIFRYVLFEIGLLSAAAVLGGLLFAAFTHGVIIRLAPALPRVNELELDLGSFVIALAAGLTCWLATGLASYKSAFVANPERSLRDITGAHTGSGRLWSRVLLSAQSVIVMALLLGAGLLLRTLWHVSQLNVGFTTSQLTALQTRVEVPQSEVADWENYVLRVAQQYRSQLAGLPQVLDVAVSGTLPFFGIDRKTWVPQSAPDVIAAKTTPANARQVSEGFIETLGIRVLAGRSFERADARDGPSVVVVSASVADRLFGTHQVVGRSLDWGQRYEIIGVVDDVMWSHPEQSPQPAFYVLFEQHPSTVVSWIVRTRPGTAIRSDQAAEIFWRVAPTQALDVSTTLDALLQDTRANRRFLAAITASLAAIALLLGTAGIFAGVETAVSDRTKEIAVRSALGASPGSIRVLVIREAVFPALAGLGGGLLLAIGSARFVSSFLFGVGVIDPITFIGTAGLLLTTACAGGYHATIRAERIAPAVALK